MEPRLIPRLQSQFGAGHFIKGMGALLRRTPPEPLVLPDTDLELLPVASGRAGLYLILQALELSPGSGIAVPLYCCPTVFEAIRQAGHRPVFVDTEQQHYSMSPGALREAIHGSGDIGAAVVVHMFGLPARTDDIIDAAGGLPVIEDCAHAVGTRQNGRQAGASGVASFFSFGRGKWPAIGGGAVQTTNAALEARLQAAIDSLPKPSRASQGLRSLRTLAISTLYRPPWYGLFALAAAERLDNRLDLRGTRDFRVSRMDWTDRHVVARCLADFPAQLARRRQNAAQLIAALEDYPLGLATGHPGDEPNWYLFPVRFRTGNERDEARKHLRRCGIDTMAYLANVGQVARDHYAYSGNCPETERAAERTLVVPHYHSLRQSQLEHIAESLQEFARGATAADA